MMQIGIVGLGLIGGSMAKAFKQYIEAEIWAEDANPAVMTEAQKMGVIDGVLDGQKLKECQLVLLALYPEAALAYLHRHADDFNPQGIVMDLCGIKQKICTEAFALAREHGFHYLGGHPMAGTHKIGFKYSRANMFKEAAMILVPQENEKKELIEKAQELLAPLGFGRFTLTTPLEHDQMIAFTSQLAHVVSNAYIKSPTAAKHKGFSAGSYKDLTRVAWLNELMWAELFLDNKTALLNEIVWLEGALEKYRQALLAEDREALENLLREGRLAKERIDGYEKSRG